MKLFPLWLWERAQLRVNDNFINSVAFIGLVNDRDMFVPYGTGFCVLWAAKTLGVPHIVTALHVIDDIPGEQVWIRVIKNGGGFHLITIPKSSFAVHSDHDPDRSYIDVAVASLPKVVPDDPIAWIREEDFITDNIISSQNIGIGDEVVVAGMLFPRLGQTKNLPIVRVGNIAAMRDAYLTETRSIDGLSGSPVFVHMGVRPPVRKTAPLGSMLQHYFLGLIHGHYVVNGGGDIVRVQTTAPSGDMNSGIAIVVPASRISDIIEHPDNKRTREQWADAHFARIGKTAD
jgi:hypothetical protein